MTGFWQSPRFVPGLVVFAASIVFFVLYLLLFSKVLGWDLPKTRNLKHENAVLMTRSGMLNHELDRCAGRLAALQLRDEEIYRSVFGLNSISDEYRESGLDSEASYDDLDAADRSKNVSSIKQKSDMLVKKAYVQSRSYDEVVMMLNHADNMSTSIPAIAPVIPDLNRIHLSSGYGQRFHPVLKWSRMHRGVDFSLKQGSAVFATGDGTVESIKVEMHGYGRQVTIDHGFGYKTRYAHLNTILVTEGMKVKRGEQIATSGNSGLTSGPHLHYEVLYKGNSVNPANYFDNDFDLERYREMIKQVESSSEKFFVHPMHAR